MNTNKTDFLDISHVGVAPIPTPSNTKLDNLSYLSWKLAIEQLKEIIKIQKKIFNIDHTESYNEIITNMENELNSAGGENVSGGFCYDLSNHLQIFEKNLCYLNNINLKLETLIN